MLANTSCFCLLFCLISLGCSAPAPASEAGEDTPPACTSLIDGRLSQWDRYLSFQHQPGYDGAPPLDETGQEVAPVGLNPEGYDLFQVQEEAGDTVIRVGGSYYGCLISKAEYENYHFQLKFRWGEEKWVPRKTLLKDSGILYHSIGPLGVEHWRTWMLSQEFQIMEGHTGDYWNQATSAMDIRAYTPEYLMDPMAHASQDFLPVGEGSPYKNYCLRSNNYEQPHGEWNTLDLICFEDKSLHLVNGEVVMILQNSRYVDEADQVHPLQKGKIQLQAEAAEIFFKDIQIKPLDSLTINHQAYFQEAQK
ncbi:MAG: DUF1080 domain-containing protein [Bacteroidota bacterium]